MRSRREIWGMACRHGAFAVAPVMITAFAVRLALQGHVFAVDFEHSTFLAGRSLLAGVSPYVAPSSPSVAAGAAFVYPPLAAVLSVPFALLPRFGAAVAFTGLSMLAVVFALRALDVRDWRVYGVIFLWPPVISGWQTANLSLLLCLGVALVWRWRDRAALAGLLVGVLVAVKLFLWPLTVWLLVTRRWTAAAWAAVGGFLFSGVAWAVVGFDQIRAYSALVRALARLEDSHGYGLVALTGSRAAAVVAAAVGGAAVAVLGRSGRERAAFGLCVLVCLTASPLVWLHYFALLLVPLALVRPTLAISWFVPLLMLSPPTSPRPWQVGVALGVASLVSWLVIVDRAPSVEAGTLDRGRRFAIPIRRSRSA